MRVKIRAQVQPDSGLAIREYFITLHDALVKTQGWRLGDELKLDVDMVYPEVVTLQKVT